jgi:hypothetical protein
MLLIFVLLSLSHGALNCLSMTNRNSLLDCFSTYIDKNNDSAIDRSELSLFFVNRTEQDVSKRIFNRCDVNRDNLLTLEDWNMGDCCKSYDAIVRTCIECQIAGWTVPSK